MPSAILITTDKLQYNYCSVFTRYSLCVSVVNVEGDTSDGEGDSKNGEDSGDPE